MSAGLLDQIFNYLGDEASGTDAHGSSYYKFPNGTLIQWGTYKTSATSATQTGSIYIKTFYPNITFPVSFTEAPKVSMTQYGGYGAVFTCSFDKNGINSVDLARPTSGNITPDISWIAIGKWK